jgi:hypothetical protein
MEDFQMPTLQNIANHRMYPEVYYKVQPYILMACDEIDIYDDFEMPSSDMIMQMSDQIYSDVCRMHPECMGSEPFREMSQEAAAAYQIYGNVEYQQVGPGGLFNDLITIMLLNELFGRRRRRRRY